MSRAKRALRVNAYLRLWTYMNASDRTYAMCWFARLRDQRAARLRLDANTQNALVSLIATLGLQGAVAAAILRGLIAITPEDVLQCDQVIQRGEGG